MKNLLCYLMPAMFEIDSMNKKETVYSMAKHFRKLVIYLKSEGYNHNFVKFSATAHTPLLHDTVIFSFFDKEPSPRMIIDVWENLFMMGKAVITATSLKCENLIRTVYEEEYKLFGDEPENFCFRYCTFSRNHPELPFMRKEFVNLLNLVKKGGEQNVSYSSR